MKSSSQPFRILVSEKVSDIPEDNPAISFLYEPDIWQDAEKFARSIQDVDGLIVRNQTQVSKAVLENAKKLRVIGRLGAGLDNIDVEAARAAGIQIVYAPDANTLSVAEYCLAQIFNILRMLPQAIDSTASGEWSRSKFTGRELSETVIGLVGFGKIGRALAERIHFLGGKVIVSTRSPEKVPNLFAVVSLPELLAQADVVSLHVPGGPETKHLISASHLEIMKPTAWLLNTARGSVVDENALTAALTAGKISGAVLDVRATEPPVVGNLEKLPNVFLTPHIAAFTGAAQKRVSQVVFADVSAVLLGQEPQFPYRR